jgi:hypothetical protein
MNRRYVDLTSIADRHRTDKGSLDGDCHLYTELYSACFESFRLDPFNLLELGLLRSPNSDEEKYPLSRLVDRTPSVDMWLEYFPNAGVFGFDLADFSTLRKPRFTFVRGDLSSDSDVDQLASSIPNPRIIIDDASHASFHQQRAFLKLFPMVEPGGFYVIEDLHYSPPFESSLPTCRLMVDIVSEFLDSGTLHLDFGTSRDSAKLGERISNTFMHCSARGRKDWGPKLVVFQKDARA